MSVENGIDLVGPRPAFVEVSDLGHVEYDVVGAVKWMMFHHVRSLAVS